MNDVASRLLDLLADEGGVSAARACKRLDLSRSELQRLLAQLGDHPQLGGLDLIRVAHEGGRDVLRLTEHARAARSAR